MILISHIECGLLTPELPPICIQERLLRRGLSRRRLIQPLMKCYPKPVQIRKKIMYLFYIFAKCIIHASSSGEPHERKKEERHSLDVPRLSACATSWPTQVPESAPAVFTLPTQMLHTRRPSAQFSGASVAGQVARSRYFRQRTSLTERAGSGQNVEPPAGSTRCRTHRPIK